MRGWPLLLLALAGCDVSMRDQARGDPQGAATLWPGGPQVAPPPEGTIALDQPARDAAFATPPPLTPALVDRGEQRYRIFCTPCHGLRGEGDGIVVQRGFPKPPSFREARLIAAPPAYVVQVVTYGRGVMYSYADRVPAPDRWAIAAYVKALQKVPAR